jgi:hypothetical protein
MLGHGALGEYALSESALVADTTDDLLANDVASASSVSTPAIGQVHVILANDVASASTVSVPAVGQVHALLANDVASASSVSVPALALVTALLANDVASASSVSAPAIGQTHALNASDVASASSVTAPALSEGVVAPAPQATYGGGGFRLGKKKKRPTKSVIKDEPVAEPVAVEVVAVEQVAANLEQVAPPIASPAQPRLEQQEIDEDDEAMLLLAA